MTLLTLLNNTSVDYPNVDFNPQTGQIAVVAQPLFGAVDITQDVVIITSDNRGGWLPEHHAEEAKRRKKWKKIQEKRERRQEYVLRKIWAELQGIDLTDDPELMALMAEFETPEEVYKSAAEIQAMLNDAYMKYIVERELRIAEQDKEDEDEIMALLSLTL